MKIFLDANVLVAVLNKEYPVFSYASRILSLADHPQHTLYTSPVCLAIAYYFAEKKTSAHAAKNKISILLEHIKIAENSKNAILKTLENKKILDFEDGLEYYAALENKCDCIVTENLKDFHFSEIQVVNCKDFALKYFVKS
ncbi:PIN domain-containing protein [Pedobacter cryophilus]|uniref:PIN domain-containing protein n=1 Tax=Pedobacter cryophilus TaxID=2571271 RepID=A0A4U1C3E0_9SPHI|nr:PIN domain-containing protein [Pedobacter cryophilus]TKB97714.1 PIN domain-containing protein [Pedobacter cryophilus]